MSRRSQQRQGSQFVHAVTNFTGVAHIDRIARQAFDSPRDIGPAYSARDDLLDIGDVKAVPRRCGAIDVDIDIAPAGKPLGQSRTDAGDRLCHTLDLERHPFDLGKILARDLNADRALDSGRKHIDAVTDRGYPDIGETGHLNDPVEFFDQRIGRHAFAPFLPRPEPDRGLEHGERSRVGSRICTAGLAEDCFDFRYRFDEAVGPLQQRRGLAWR